MSSRSADSLNPRRDSSESVSDAPIRVLLLGDATSPSMRPVVRALEDDSAETVTESAQTVETAIAMIEQTGRFPDLIVVCQHWPDEWAANEFRQLLDVVPLARWICCYGPWCEADGRTRDIWPSAIRVPAWRAEHRIRRELAVLRGEALPLPLTAGRDELFIYDYSEAVKPIGSGEPVGVMTSDPALEAWWIDLLTAAGYEPVPLARLSSEDFETVPSPAELRGLLWDADPWSERQRDSLAAFCSQFPDVGVLALMNLPFPEDVCWLESFGVRGVLSKVTPQTVLLERIVACCSGE